MRTHDIVCVADGWAYQLNGVEVAQYPSWQMAVTAARRAAEHESRQGLAVALRYRGVDGEMKDIQTRPKRGTEAIGNRGAPEPVSHKTKAGERPQGAVSG